MNTDIAEILTNRNSLRRITHLELSTRTKNAMANEGIIFLGELAARAEPELLRIPNFGRTSLNELKDVTLQNGLQIGSHLSIDSDQLQAAIAQDSDDIRQLLSNRNLLRSIEDVGLSRRTLNVLRLANVPFIGELTIWKEEDLLHLRDLGNRGFKEIKNMMAQHGLKIGLYFDLDKFVQKALTQALQEIYKNNIVMFITGDTLVTENPLGAELNELFKRAGAEIGNGPMPQPVRDELVRALKFAREHPDFSKK